MESPSLAGIPVQSHHNLVDFDWSLKAVFGTSTTVAQAPPPLVGVDLHLCAATAFDPQQGHVTETIHLEMSNQELKTFIGVLEKTVNPAH